MVQAYHPSTSSGNRCSFEEFNHLSNAGNIFTRDIDERVIHTHQGSLRQLHLAFVSEDPHQERERLLKAGAKLIEEQHLPDGSHLLMMRDPWGLAIQFCKRADPML